MNPDSPYPVAPTPAPTLPQPYQPTQAPAPVKKTGSKWYFLIPIILLALLLLGAVGFGLWAFTEREDYKSNVDQKVAAAVEVAKQETKTAEAQIYLEREKNPYKKYKTPATFGSVDITYPKTWSAAVTENQSGTAPVNGFFHPDFVPGERSGTAFALRLEVLQQSYSQTLSRYESDARNGKVRIAPFKAAKVPEVLGARIDGEIARNLRGSTVMFPLRDKTIRITVQSQQFMNDFNTIILPNLVFVP